jgi:YfiH family protein
LGDSGQGDALWTAEADLALSVATADCVPVLLGGGGVAAAIHAGWRGIAAGILGATISALPAAPGELTAWIGPAIGPCCYEVGEDVAERVAGDARSQVVLPGARGRPHLDLARAVSLRLAEHGVGRVIEIPSCTRCDSERLWSFRRDGAASGRNLAFVWLRG